MRIKLVINAVGLIFQSIGLLLILPLLVALYYNESFAIYSFGYTGLFSIILGTIIRYFILANEPIRRTEGIVIVVLTWLIAALIGSIPYIFFNLNFVDALFESMSGFTTTGATIFQDFSIYPKSIFFWRSFTQWIGGMGIIVLFIAILPQFALAGRQLFFAEAPGPTEEKLTPRIKQTATCLWTLYIILTVLEIILLFVFGMPLFDAICNSFSTLAAGGFSPNPESIMGYHSSSLEWIITLFMFLAGANFSLQFKVVWLRNPMMLLKNSEFLLYTIIFISASVILTLLLIISNDYFNLDALRIAAFQCISILTTTGFATIDYIYWIDSSKMVLVALMFIGGSAGSSAGGIKIVRILIMIKAIILDVIKTVHPKSILSLRLDRQIVSEHVLRQIFVFFIVYMMIFLLSTILISFIESDMVLGFSSAIATLGNIGPGFGIIGPMGNYSSLHETTKIILIINMWIGRLEVMSVLVLLSPFTWKYLLKR